MLRYLKVRNLVLIREISLEFFPGLTVLTGETGAGKSILVDSLALLLGERAGGDQTRWGEKGGSVEAIFDVSRRADLLPYLEERGWEPEEGELTLRRELVPGGRGRAFVGSHLASVADLGALGRRLVDLHGQHEHQTLLRTSEHLSILDRSGDNREARDRLAALNAEIRGIGARLDAWTRDRQETARRIDILKFQVEEIERAVVRPGETEALRSERIRARNQEKIRECALLALESLYEGEGAALARLDGVLSSTRELIRYDASAAPALARAEEAVLALKDLAEALRDAGRERESGPARLEEIEARLAQLESLTRKYGPDEEAIRAFGSAAALELGRLNSEEGSRESLESKLEEACSRFSREASALSAKRQRDARALEKAVRGELADLAMERTDWVVDFRVAELPGSPVQREEIPVAFGADGWDQVQFLVRTNPGEPLRPLAKIASGGELSRLMLAVHGVLREASDGAVRVFDEVDAGIGGRVAETVGRKMKHLSRKGQILCVTHLPQIASLADHHLAVSKRVRAGRAEVTAEALDRAGTVREVARMLGGERVSEITLKHAAEMVERES